MATLLSAAALIVGLVLLWTWRVGLEVSSFGATFLSAITVASFIVSIITLGWIGVAILFVVCISAVITWSIVLAIRKQSILTAATVEALDLTPVQAGEIWRWMGTERSFASIGPLERAELIRVLAASAREQEEIRLLAVPIAELSLQFDLDPSWLASHFDRLLRLYGMEAARASEAAATVAATIRLSPAAPREIVEAMLIAGGDDVLADPDSMALEGAAPPLDALRAATEFQIHRDGEQGVRLNGGPLDGWLVLSDAPSLAEDWYRTWPPGFVGKHEPGRYVIGASGTWAEWRTLEN
jgi:hypothetical protein